MVELHQQAVDFVDNLFSLSPYLLSPIQPPNSQGSLFSHPPSSLTCSQDVWEGGPRIESGMQIRGDIRVDKGSQTKQEELCGLQEITVYSAELLQAFWKHLNVCWIASYVMETGILWGSFQVCRLRLPDLVNKNKGSAVNSEFQISSNNNTIIFSVSVSHAILGTYIFF